MSIQIKKIIIPILMIVVSLIANITVFADSFDIDVLNRTRNYTLNLHICENNLMANKVANYTKEVFHQNKSIDEANAITEHFKLIPGDIASLRNIQILSIADVCYSGVVFNDVNKTWEIIQNKFKPISKHVKENGCYNEHNHGFKSITKIYPQDNEIDFADIQFAIEVSYNDLTGKGLFTFILSER